MLTRLLPEFVKRPIRTYFQNIAADAATTQQRQLYFPSHLGKDDYCVETSSDTPKLKNAGLPVPPKELWLGYASTDQDYIDGGKHDVSKMVQILEEGDFSVGNSKRIMEFGCASGRMIRHLCELAPNSELLGVDVSADHIRWCINNLTPNIHFANTSTMPHLPFEDRNIDLVFCGSVFTHIEDIQEAWLFELGRVLRKTGRLYLTIHDEHTIKLLDSQNRDHWLSGAMRENSTYSSNKDDFKMIVVGRGIDSQVFYNLEYFRSIVPPCFRWVSHTPEAYGYQSAVVLEKL